MNELGYKILKLTQVIMPPDFPQRLKTENVKNIAHSAFQSEVPIGIINPPTVRRVGEGTNVRWVVCTGGDRLAAMTQANVDRCYFRMVECTDREFELMQLAENLDRRDDLEKRQTRRERMQNLVAGQVAAEVKAGTLPNPQRMKTEIRERIAKATGVTPAAVRKQEQRAKARLEQVRRVSQPVVTPDELATKASIETFGYPLKRSWLEPVEHTRELLERATRAMVTVQGTLTEIASRDLPFPPGRLQRLREQAESLAAEIRGCIPESLCSYCKGQSGVEEHCASCAAKGFITRSQVPHVPPELTDPLTVFLNGEFKSLEELQQQPEEPQEKPTGVDPLAEFED